MEAGVQQSRGSTQIQRSRFRSGCQAALEVRQQVTAMITSQIARGQ